MGNILLQSENDEKRCHQSQSVLLSSCHGVAFGASVDSTGSYYFWYQFSPIFPKHFAFPSLNLCPVPISSLSDQMRLVAQKQWSTYITVMNPWAFTPIVSQVKYHALGEASLRISLHFKKPYFYAENALFQVINSAADKLLCFQPDLLNTMFGKTGICICMHIYICVCQ